MGLDSFMGSLGTELIWLFIGSGFALVWGGTTAALALQAGRMSPLRLVLGAVLAALISFGLGQLAVLGWPAQSAPALKLAAMTHAALHLVGPLSFGPVASITLLACAWMGIRARPWRWTGPALVLGLVLLAAAAVVAGGYGSSNLLYPSMRACVYVAVGLLIAVSLSGRSEEGTALPGAAEAGLTAGCLAPLVVAIGEASERGLVHLLLVQQAVSMPEGKWALAMPKMLAHTGPEWSGSQLALAVASAVAWLPMLLAGRQIRPGWVLASLLSTLTAWAVLMGSDLGEQRLAALALLREP